MPRIRPEIRTSAVFLPFALTLALAGLAFIGPVRQNTFLGAALLLALWNAALILSRRTLTLEVVLRKQHYIQACAQGSVLLYWGWYWPPVYAFAPFILAQLLFAWAFDMLLGWSRRNTCTLGFAPLPVVFSINLFLWFKPEWFYLQFAMVALGLAAKEFIRWYRGGRRVHIFNPSSFPLAVFSIALLAAGRSDITFGQNIATTQFYPPQMYLALFLIGLPGQFFFGVTSMTMSAVVAAYSFSRIYFAITGIYFFYDSYIPIAVFLGMHLLFNDPTTSPRTEWGRIIYGALYGLSTAALYALLGHAGLPTFYDKLLQVPLLNLSVPVIDRWFVSPVPGKPALVSRRRNLAYIGVWAVVFATMSAQSLSDNFPGQWIPFWRKACDDGRPYACPYLADTALNLCHRDSGWACNEAGLLHIALARSGEDTRRADLAGAAEPFQRGCGLGFQAACGNLAALRGSGGALVSAPPALSDYPIILRGSKGEISQKEPSALYALACREQWPETCQSPVTDLDERTPTQTGVTGRKP